MPAKRCSTSSRRVNPNHDAADLWFRVNHIAIDGVPAQELIAKLESTWGTRDLVRFPAPEEFAAHIGPRSCAGRNGHIEMQAFIDFAPLLGWRKRVNANLAEPITLSAAMLWNMAQARCI